ncbi:MAG: L,D-transpeptidase [Muribaculum sp.]|nr:L,D-transpeptidase [Muribaculum sp.]
MPEAETINAESIRIAEIKASGDTTDMGNPMVHFDSTEEALEWMRKSGNWDKYNEGILPQMAREQLNYAEKLLNNEHPRFIIADKATMKVYLYDKYGRQEASFPMACSRYYGTKHKRRDNRTPDGFFTAEGVYNSESWLYTDDDGNTSQAKGVYGPKFIRVKVPGTNAIGIHGTNAPWSVGRRVSHGCMRLNNDDIRLLAANAEKGMPIIISPSSRDMAVNASEGYHIPSVAVTRGGSRVAAGEYSVRKESNNTIHHQDTISGDNSTEQDVEVSEPSQQETNAEESDTTPNSDL